MFLNFSISNLPKHFSKFTKKTLDHLFLKKYTYFYKIALPKLDKPKGIELWKIHMNHLRNLKESFILKF